jgi:hypothetical protein
MSSAVRPRAASAATLPAGPPPPAVVVGAVARPRLIVSSEPTFDTAPMRFEAAPPSPEHVPSGMPPAPEPDDPLSMPPSRIPSLVPPVLAVGAGAHPHAAGGRLSSLLSRPIAVLAGGAALLLLLGAVGTAAVLRSRRPPAPGAGAAAAEASASSAVEEPAPAPPPLASSPSASSASPEAPPASSQSAPGAAPFVPAVARRALDAIRPEVAKCRHGKVWGHGLATVTFSNEGSVDNVALARPLAGTPTGACAADALAKAHVAPFAGAAAPISYAFYVSPK